MSYFYEKEKKFRETIEKLVVFSDQINDVYTLYEKIYDKADIGEIFKLAEDISVFFETVKENYNYNLFKIDTDTLFYSLDSHYKDDLVNITKVIEQISADGFEKLCALFLKEIVKCESVNATQRSHDQGIDFVG